jgi:hypothetical protein
MTDLRWDTNKESFSSILALFFFVCVVIFPFFIWILLWKKIDKLKNEDFADRFGSTYFELKTDNKNALLYNVFYTLRRLLIAVLVIFAGDIWVMQILLMLFHSQLLLIYLIKVQPYVLPELNYLEIFNETSICIASYHLLFFTDFTTEPEFQYKVGWSIIGITTINILVNMLIMVKATIIKLKFAFRKLRHQYRLR